MERPVSESLLNEFLLRALTENPNASLRGIEQQLGIPIATATRSLETAVAIVSGALQTDALTAATAAPQTTKASETSATELTEAEKGFLRGLAGKSDFKKRLKALHLNAVGYKHAIEALAKKLGLKDVDSVKAYAAENFAQTKARRGRPPGTSAKKTAAKKVAPTKKTAPKKKTAPAKKSAAPSPGRFVALAGTAAAPGKPRKKFGPATLNAGDSVTLTEKEQRILTVMIAGESVDSLIGDSMDARAAGVAKRNLRLRLGLNPDSTEQDVRTQVTKLTALGVTINIEKPSGDSQPAGDNDQASVPAEAKEN